MNSRRVFKRLYKIASEESDLEWHREEIPPFLEKVMSTLPANSNVLDIGCGTGVFSVYMAKHNAQVTAIDFIPEALDFAKKRAERESVRVDFQQADITQWQTDKKFKLILDSGCLHSLDNLSREIYKKRIPDFLDDDGVYILIHFGKKHLFDFSIMGPKRRSKKAMVELMSPEFRLADFEVDPKDKRAFHYLFVKRKE